MMDDKLEINLQQKNQLTILTIKGRLDAFGSNRLGETLDQLIREGSYELRLDMGEVYYMSSAGIRILINYFKKLKDIQGSFMIIHPSDKVKHVLEMAGLRLLFSTMDHPTQQERTESTAEQISGSALYRLHTLNLEHTMKGVLAGNPELIFSPSITNDQIITLNVQQPMFGIGLGAFGDDFNDYKHRLGEFIGLGDVMACLPTDWKNQPDYLMKEGQWFPKVNLLYGILYEGKFSHRVHFESLHTDHGIPFSQILEDMQHMTGYKDMALLMVAETTGLIGMSLNRSPVHIAEMNQELFSFPAIREQVDFTPEHSYEGMLTLTTGVMSISHENWRRSFLRPVTHSKTFLGHFHSAVFSYHPLKKQIVDYRETVQALFDQHHFFTLLHLTNDQRSLAGIGESEFKQGTCWVSSIESFNIQTESVI